MMIIKWPHKVGTAWTFHNKQRQTLFSLVRSQADGEARKSGSEGTGRQEGKKKNILTIWDFREKCHSRS